MKIERTHPCYDLLLYLYKRGNDKIVGKENALLVLSMEKASNIKELIGIRDSVLMILVSIIYSKEYISEGWWFNRNCWPKSEVILWLQLDYFFNQNIKRLFDASNKLTDKFCLKCIINLRESNNCEELFEYIISRSPVTIQSYRDRLLSLISTNNKLCTAVTKHDIVSQNKKVINKYFKTIEVAKIQGYIKGIDNIYLEKKIKRFKTSKYPSLSKVVDFAVKVLLIALLGFIFVKLLLPLLSLFVFPFLFWLLGLLLFAL